MTNEEKRIRIAEACGWTYNEVIREWVASNKAPITGDKTTYGLPDYLNDLNAMHEAEKVVWIDRYRYDYNNNLDRVVGATPVKGSESKIGPWIYEYNKARRATAAQRAEAFGLTLNLWSSDQ